MVVVMAAMEVHVERVLFGEEGAIHYCTLIDNISSLCHKTSSTHAYFRRTYESWKWNSHDQVYRIVEARDVFERLLATSVVSWNAMITGHTKHGCWLI